MWTPKWKIIERSDQNSEGQSLTETTLRRATTNYPVRLRVYKIDGWKRDSRECSGPLAAPPSASLPSLIDISAIKCLDYRSTRKRVGGVYKSCERARLLLTLLAIGSCRSVSRNIEFHVDAAVCGSVCVCVCLCVWTPRFFRAVSLPPRARRVAIVIFNQQHTSRSYSTFCGVYLRVLSWQRDYLYRGWHVNNSWEWNNPLSWSFHPVGIRATSFLKNR